MNKKIEIYSIHYNKPEYIKLQYDSFKKFINFDFEFYVIDNSVNIDLKNRIQQECETNKINYLFTNNTTRHNPMLYGWSHIFGMNFFKERLLKSEADYVFLIEHDIFICSSLSKILPLIENNAICGISQYREEIVYLHLGLLLFNKKIPTDLYQLDFRGDVIENGVLNPDLNGVRVDTGGHTYKYIKSNNDKVFFIDEYVNHHLLQDIEEKHIFYHMVCGSNWSGLEDDENQKKLEKIKKIIYE